MFEATALFETEHGGAYATKLCQHFAHKADVTRSENGGECRFSYGTATFQGEPGRLRLRASAPTPEDLAQLREVIEVHLLRFAFREGERRLDWSAATA